MKKIISSEVPVTLGVASRQKRPNGNGWIFDLTNGRRLTVITSIREGAAILEHAELRPGDVSGEYVGTTTGPVILQGPMLHIEYIILHQGEKIFASLDPQFGEGRKPQIFIGPGVLVNQLQEVCTAVFLSLRKIPSHNPLVPRPTPADPTELARQLEEEELYGIQLALFALARVALGRRFDQRPDTIEFLSSPPGEVLDEIKRDQASTR